MEKLDCAMVNEKWIDMFPNAETFFLNEGVSDHSPLVVKMDIHQGSRPAPFRYFNM